jgi:hypothetical protein
MVPIIINQNITKENFIPIDISGGRGTLIDILSRALHHLGPLIST